MQTILIISTILSWIVIGILTASVLLLGRAHAELTQYIQEQENKPVGDEETIIGRPALDFHLPSLDKKQSISLSNLRGKPILLAFLSPTCHQCHKVITQLSAFVNGWQEKGGTLLGISNGDPSEMRHLTEKLDVKFPILSQQQMQISRRYHVSVNPWGIAISAEGIVTASGPLGTPEHIAELLKAAGK